MISLPLLAVFSSALLFSFYLLLANLWSDHWVYRANICLVEGGSRWQCQKDLEHKLQILIPPRFYRVDPFWITARQSHVSLHLFFFGSAELDFLKTLSREVRSDISLPLRSSTLNTDLL